MVLLLLWKYHLTWLKTIFLLKWRQRTECLMKNCHHYQHAHTDNPLYWEPGSGHVWLDRVTQRTVNTRGCVCAACVCVALWFCLTASKWTSLSVVTGELWIPVTVAAVPRGPVSPRTGSSPERRPSGRSSSGRCWPGCNLLQEKDGNTRPYWEESLEFANFELSDFNSVLADKWDSDGLARPRKGPWDLTKVTVRA